MEEHDSGSIETVDIVRYHGGEGFPADDTVAREEPLELRLNGRTLVYLMRLPGDDRLLAAGFCLSEGLIERRESLEISERPNGSIVEITANAPDGADSFGEPRVIRTGSGGAGLAGGVDVSGIKVESDAVFPTGIFAGLPGALLESQEVFRDTGGTHGAGLFDTSGRVLVVKEDVGRHNAVDKVLGHLLLSAGSPERRGLILSGRLSFEMVLKCARAGIPLVCSVSAPTALGVHLGRKTGVTLVGFLRGEGFNVYSHTGRIGGG